MYVCHTKSPKKKREGKTVFLGVKGQGQAFDWTNSPEGFKL